MAQVTMRSLNKKYDEVHAVKDVNLDIHDKEFVVLVGPSGCGKTTTLRMVAGLESITSGRVLIDDTVVNDLAPMDRDIAMVFQNYALYPHMSVYDNMAFGLKMRKFDKAETMTLGDRVVVMRDGWVQQVGDPMELYNEPANRFVAGFIGSPAMNFADVRIEAENGGLWAIGDGIRLKVPAPMQNRVGAHSGKEVTFGIRPEDLLIASDADPIDQTLEATVQGVERLGSEILLDCAIG